WMAELRKLAANALRANPNLIAHNITGLVDPSTTGEGMLSSTFRELKPGVIDAMFDAFAPLRWCLFVEPVQVFCGGPVRIEAVLANEDVLSPGEYPVRFQVVGPQNVSVFDRTETLTIPDTATASEPSFALPVLDEQVVIEGPPGKYRFFATFQKNAAAAGGQIEFYAADAGEMPELEFDVVLWGDDAVAANWLDTSGIPTREFELGTDESPSVILVGAAPPVDKSEAFRELAKQIARGSHAVFLSPDVFAEGEHRARWLPLANKGDIVGLTVTLYHKDDWAKNHPIFEGLPAGRVLEHTFYREMLSGTAFSGQDVPSEVVAGAINTCLGYSSGLTVAVYDLGAGGFTLNSLRIRDVLGSDPVAERLLRNMLNHAGRRVNPQPTPLPADFDEYLSAIGY
ncbi:MAG: glycoside hydrolase family 2, partial [Candidatus Poribacteria bacterium]|nr:glycoside hydrolase family 2 [Candidatus Poribacteria bacterium]